jgi:hypothetical protein
VDLYKEERKKKKFGASWLVVLCFAFEFQVSCVEKCDFVSKPPHLPSPNFDCDCDCDDAREIGKLLQAYFQVKICRYCYGARYFESYSTLGRIGRFMIFIRECFSLCARSSLPSPTMMMMTPPHQSYVPSQSKRRSRNQSTSSCMHVCTHPSIQNHRMNHKPR